MPTGAVTPESDAINMMGCPGGAGLGEADSAIPGNGSAAAPYLSTLIDGETVSCTAAAMMTPSGVAMAASPRSSEFAAPLKVASQMRVPALS